MFSDRDRGSFVGYFFEFTDDSATLISYDKFDPAIAIRVVKVEGVSALVGNRDGGSYRFVAEVLFVIRFDGNRNLSKQRRAEE